MTCGSVDFVSARLLRDNRVVRQVLAAAAMWIVVACLPTVAAGQQRLEAGSGTRAAVRSYSPALQPEARFPGSAAPAASEASSRSGPSAGTAPQTAPPGAEPVPPPGPGFFRIPEERFIGTPEPLVRETWLNRPYSLGVFVGLIEGGSLIDDWIYQDSGLLAGVRVGWDNHDYWGMETRFAWAGVDTHDGWRAREAAGDADSTAIGPGGSNKMFLWDANILFYPAGDTRWRPYLSAGMGLASVDFHDRLGTNWSDTMFALPLAVGLKYRCGDFFALRIEATQNLVFASRPMEFLDNASFTGGIEYRFGGARRAYWPWNPGRHYW